MSPPALQLRICIRMTSSNKLNIAVDSIPLSDSLPPPAIPSLRISQHESEVRGAGDPSQRNVNEADIADPFGYHERVDPAPLIALTFTAAYSGWIEGWSSGIQTRPSHALFTQKQRPKYDKLLELLKQHRDYEVIRTETFGVYLSFTSNCSPWSSSFTIVPLCSLRVCVEKGISAVIVRTSRYKLEELKGLRGHGGERGQRGREASPALESV
ncbi:hypothetical protein BT69DRAFT_1304664 [Atractiella rhizophila]|nr:hypothetical protein BT69DRAFT_1304664 [Atractiella rhizophila]